MEHKDSVRDCKTGDATGAGVYICQQCNFAIVSMKNSYTLPACPCCEGTLFIECEQEEPVRKRSMEQLIHINCVDFLGECDLTDQKYDLVHAKIAYVGLCFLIRHGQFYKNNEISNQRGSR